MTAALATVPTTHPAGPRPVTLRPVPELEPQFDDELAAAAPPCPGGVLPLPLPRSRAVPWRAARPGHGGLPDPAAWSRRLLVGLIESADGRRPLNQLAAFLSPSVHRGVGTQFERAAVAGRPHWLREAGVRSIHTCEPASGVVELCAVLDTGARVRALAMRIEQWRGQWRCTRLQLG